MNKRLIPMLGYVRVSRAREEMISPDIQRMRIQQWAAQNGRVLVDWLEDLNRTGREFGKRQVEAGIARVATGAVAEIGVYRYDRWGRNTVESLANIAKVEQAGGRVVSATEPFDAETAIGRYTRTNALALAQMQSDIISENWRDAIAHRRRRGVPHSGQARFGYTYEGDGNYTPDPVTGPLLAGLYQRYVAGVTHNSLARELSAAGYRTSRGQPWIQDTVRDMLDSGFGAGLLVTNTFRPAGAPKPVREYLPGSHEPVIDAATWEAYRARRATVAARPARLRRATYRLSGLLRCWHCGAPCVHTSNKGRGYTGRTIVCNTHRHTGGCVPLYRDRREVERLVAEWLREQATVADTEFVRREAAARRRVKRAARDREHLEQEHKAAEAKLLKLTDGWLSGVVPELAYPELRDKLTARLRELEEALAAPPEPEVPVAAIKGIAEAWEALEPGPANEALRRLVSAVRVGRETVEVIPRWA